MELAFQDSTRTLGRLPMLASSPLPPTHLRPIGLSHLGGVFCFDPFDLYRSGYLSGPNLLVLGEIGHGKSAFVKTFLVREPSAQTSLFILDPKGEYQPAAAMLGATVLTLGQGSGIDPFVGVDKDSPQLARVLVALFRVLYDRSPLPLEYRLLQELVVEMAKDSQPPTILGLAALILRDQRSADSEERRLRSEFAAQVRRLIDGDLAGVLLVKGRGPQLGARVVVDLGSLTDRRLRAFAISSLIRARMTQFGNHQVNAGFVIVDEAWSVLQDADSVREVRELFKLARSYGASVIALTHRLSDLDAEAAQLVKDVETRVVFRQSREDAEHLGETLGLGVALRERLVALPRGEALWSIGGRQFLVTHRLIDGERELVDTDQAMRGTR